MNKRNPFDDGTINVTGCTISFCPLDIACSGIFSTNHNSWKNFFKDRPEFMYRIEFNGKALGYLVNVYPKSKEYYVFDTKKNMIHCTVVRDLGSGYCTTYVAIKVNSQFEGLEVLFANQL